ncbi:hypothetical protein XENORESO_014005 [Xenotaenia resolanae]|uniref:Alpha-1,3-glucosyltransferase n=1 Tax=Xenotaenia resolanae TaxID=208358 RepID=A0ABV0WLA1_9TELE
MSIWFLQASTFSMLPLFLKDGLLVPYAVTSVGYLCLTVYLLSPLDDRSEGELKLGTCGKLFFFLPKMHLACMMRWKFYISNALMAVLSILSVVLDPPPHLPDLFPVLVSTAAFLHFLGAFLHFNIVQFSELPTKKSQKKNN